MTELAEQSCEACRIGAPRLTDAQIDSLRQEIPAWQVLTVDGVQRLVREYTFKNFSGAMAFANAVADLAEQQNHHPALTVEWGKTTVQWWTHKIGGLHRNDAVMAAKTDTASASFLQGS